MTVTCLQIGLYGYFTLGWPNGLQLVLCNVLAVSFWLVNILVFLYYAQSRGERCELAAGYGAALAWGLGLPLGLYLAPSTTLSASSKQTMLAVFMNLANLCGFLSPVASLRIAWREKDVSHVPAMLSYVNCINSTMWMAYGLLLPDVWIWGPNVIGLAICSCQVAVLLLLARTPAAGKGTGGGLEAAGAADPAALTLHTPQG